MSHLIRTLVVAIAIGVGSTGVAAQDGPTRERIATERAAATAQLAEQERVCRAQFVVTACMDAAQREFRGTQARLRREELALDEAARRATAARRKQEIAERAAAHASQPGDAGDAADAGIEAPRDGARRTPAPNPLATSAPPRSRRPSSAEDQRAEELRNEAALEARVRAAQAHRSAVERRNAERAARGKVAAPLPVPSGASAPRP